MIFTIDLFRLNEYNEKGFVTASCEVLNDEWLYYSSGSCR